MRKQLIFLFMVWAPVFVLAQSSEEQYGYENYLFRTEAGRQKHSQESEVYRAIPFDSLINTEFAFGTNFDFSDGLKANSLYADLNFTVPNFVLPEESIRPCNRFGIDLSIYQMVSIVTTDTTKNWYRDVEPNFTPQDTSLIYIDNYYKTSRSLRRENLGFRISPTYQLIRPNQESAYKSSLFLVGDFECQRAVLDWKGTSQLSESIRQDSVPDYWPRPYDLSPPPTDINDREVFYQLFFGGGLQSHIGNDVVHGHIRATIGGTNVLQTQDLVQTNNDTINNFWLGYYVCKVEIYERKKVDFKVGGEVRGYFRPKEDNSPLPTTHRIPTISFYIAKNFGMGKVADLILK